MSDKRPKLSGAAFRKPRKEKAIQNEKLLRKMSTHCRGDQDYISTRIFPILYIAGRIKTPSTSLV